MLKRVFAHFKSIGDLVSLPEKVKPLIWLIVLGTISVGGYSIEVSLAGKIFFAVLLAMMWAVTLYYYERWRQIRPPNYDKARVRALLDAAIALRRRWTTLTLTSYEPHREAVLEKLHEMQVAADFFFWDKDIQGKVQRIKKAALHRLEVEGAWGDAWQMGEDKSHTDFVDDLRAAIDDLTKSLHWANEQ